MLESPWKIFLKNGLESSNLAESKNDGNKKDRGHLKDSVGTIRFEKFEFLIFDRFWRHFGFDRFKFQSPQIWLVRYNRSPYKEALCQISSKSVVAFSRKFEKTVCIGRSYILYKYGTQADFYFEGVSSRIPMFGPSAIFMGPWASPRPYWSQVERFPIFNSPRPRQGTNGYFTVFFYSIFSFLSFFFVFSWLRRYIFLFT